MTDNDKQHETFTDALDFRIERQGGIDVLIHDTYACRPATGAELALWNALKSSWRARASGCANLLDAVLTDSRMPMSARARLRTVRNIIDARLPQDGPDQAAAVTPSAALQYDPRAAAFNAPAVAGEAADYMPGMLDRTAPSHIWLQIDTGGSNADRSEPWQGSDGVTWQDESIGGLEIQYVRADLSTTFACPQEASDAL